MYSYQYLPPRHLKRTGTVLLLCFAVGFLLVIASRDLPYASVWQALGIACLAVGVFLTTRYLVRRYAYQIQHVGEDYDLVIHQLQGDKSTVVCRISLDDVTAFYPAASKSRTARRRVGGKPAAPLYDYCPDLFPTDAWIVEAETADGPIRLKLSPDDTFRGNIEALRPAGL